MNESGISIDEACARRAEKGSGFLTDEDFATQCNSNGTIKQTITLSLKNSDTSVTINTGYVFMGVTLLLVGAIVTLWYVKRKKAHKTK